MKHVAFAFLLASLPAALAAFPWPCDSQTVALPEFPTLFTATFQGQIQKLWTASGGAIYTTDVGAADNSYKTYCARSISAVQTLTNPDDPSVSVTFRVIRTNPYKPAIPSIGDMCFLVYLSSATGPVQAILAAGDQCTFDANSPPPPLGSEGMPTIVKTAGGTPPQCNTNGATIPTWLRGKVQSMGGLDRNWTLADNYEAFATVNTFTNPNTNQQQTIYDLSSRCLNSITPLSGVVNGICVSGWSDFNQGLGYQALLRTDSQTLTSYSWIDSNAAKLSCPPNEYANDVLQQPFTYFPPLPTAAPIPSPSTSSTPAPALSPLPSAPPMSPSGTPQPESLYPAKCLPGAGTTDLPDTLTGQWLFMGYDRYLAYGNRIFFETYLFFETHCVSSVSNLITVTPPSSSGIPAYQAYIVTINNNPGYPQASPYCFVFVWPADPNPVRASAVFKPDPQYCSAANLFNYPVAPPTQTALSYYPPMACSGQGGTVPSWLQGTLVGTPPGTNPMLSKENHTVTSNAFFMQRAVTTTSTGFTSVESLSECIDSVSPFYGQNQPNAFGALLTMRLLLATGAADSTSGSGQCVLLIRRQATGTQVSAYWYGSSLRAAECPSGDYSADTALTRADWYFVSPLPAPAPSSAPSDSATPSKSILPSPSIGSSPSESAAASASPSMVPPPASPSSSMAATPTTSPPAPSASSSIAASSSPTAASPSSAAASPSAGPSMPPAASPSTQAASPSSAPEASSSPSAPAASKAPAASGSSSIQPPQPSPSSQPPASSPSPSAAAESASPGVTPSGTSAMTQTATPLPTPSNSPSSGASSTPSPSAFPSSLPALRGIVLTVPLTFPGLSLDLALANAASIQSSLAMDLQALWRGLGVSSKDVALNLTATIINSSNSDVGGGARLLLRSVKEDEGASAREAKVVSKRGGGNGKINGNNKKNQKQGTTASQPSSNFVADQLKGVMLKDKQRQFSSSKVVRKADDAPQRHRHRRELANVAATLYTSTLFPFQPGDNPSSPSTSKAQLAAMSAESYLKGNLSAAGGSATSLFPNTIQTVQSIAGAPPTGGFLIVDSNAISASPYAPPAAPPAGPSVSPTAGPGKGPGGVSGGVVIAIIIGVIAALGIAFGFVWYRMRKHSIGSTRGKAAATSSSSSSSNGGTVVGIALRPGSMVIANGSRVTSNPVLNAAAAAAANGHTSVTNSLKRLSYSHSQPNAPGAYANDDEDGRDAISADGDTFEDPSHRFSANRNSYLPAAMASRFAANPVAPSTRSSLNMSSPLQKGGDNNAGGSTRTIRVADLRGGPPISPVSPGPTQNLLSPRSKAEAARR